ncbi:MAG: NADH:ubiquinone reductase (Na(+)-transporting) subunit B [Deltaproteobacteria bacterium]|nr:NADH:ubiquinone reductase (Na(+)-transporting) subunit B [Deltaproteobacteria bacterium]
MRFLLKILNSNRTHFEKSGRLQRLSPLFEATESFLFSGSEVTSSSPHVRDGLDLKRMMIIVVIAAIPAVLMAIYNTGLQANLATSKVALGDFNSWRISLMEVFYLSADSKCFISNIFHGSLFFFPVYIVTVVVGGAWEVLFALIRRRDINEGFLVTSILFPLILPPDIPLWQVALGISFGVVIGKEVFGGVGMNILNPALTGRVFLFFAYPAEISGNSVWVGVDAVSSATWLGDGGVDAVSSATPLSAFADSTLSNIVTWTDAFLGFMPGSMGETSTLACLIGAFILIITGVGSWRIMVSVLIGMTTLSLLLNIIGSETNPLFSLSPLWHLVLGGFAFGVVYMATDPVTAAMTEGGKVVYGLLIGFLVVLVRVLNPAFPEGMMFAILFANVFAPIIDRVFINLNIKRRAIRNGN